MSATRAASRPWRRRATSTRATRASAIILGEEVAPVSIPSLRTDDPYLAFARALEIFFLPVPPAQGIHPTAVIAADVQIGQNACIGAYAVIGKGCKIGDGVVLHAHVVLYPEVTVGDASVLHSFVVVREKCRIGCRVVLQNGAVVGSDGFGFAPRKDGSFYKICQTGCVIVEDDVEIGANTTIDRATLGSTILRRGVKLDNLIQIAHNVEIGENTVIAAQTGISGSTKIGRNCMIAGQVGIIGHLVIGNDVKIGAQSGISTNLKDGTTVLGSPAFEIGRYRKSYVMFRNLPDIVTRLEALEKLARGGGKP